MSEQKISIAEQVRAVLADRPDHAYTYAALYEALQDAGVDTADNMNAINKALSYLADGGYVERLGYRETATFQSTGKAMVRPRLSREESDRRRRERDRLRHQALRAQMAAPRERRVDANTVARPKPVKVAPQPGVTETVDQFLARGGRVERLTTHWEQMEQAA
ncbi:hypothetical protein [Stenotrophomonas sp. NPDC078853]|uniref:hypothetical protein n=1 Tax=Stenotrophomonas sp. NPDC078853 TaxID=3364534 RepID=UPI00384B40C5